MTAGTGRAVVLADARATTRACPKLALWLDRG
jgi:hypothetical protein